jgi:penicillin-binding protein 2B
VTLKFNSRNWKSFPKNGSKPSTSRTSPALPYPGKANRQIQIFAGTPRKQRKKKFFSKNSSKIHAEHGISLVLLNGIKSFFGGIMTAIAAMWKRQAPENQISFAVFTCFALLISQLAGLQIFSGVRIDGTRSGISNESLFKLSGRIITPNRGQIYIQDISRNQNKIAMTSTQMLANLSIDPSEVKPIAEKLGVENVAKELSASLNISYSQVLDLIKRESSQQKPSRYALLQQFIGEDQKRIAWGMIEDRENPLKYYNWLRVEEVMQRNYPNNELAASTIGYMLKYKATRDEAIKTECREAIEENERNNAASPYYPIGYYGIEQKFCSILSGRNGKNIWLGNNFQREESIQKTDGSDVYLTLDMTLQQKAEELVRKAIKDNTNGNGKPRDASITIMNPNTGDILAMASYPGFDPNAYQESDPNAFRNIASSAEYEVGSTMKPLTVAAALNEWELGTTGSQGQRLGVPSTWKKRDYDRRGKIYQELNGNTLTLTNSQNISYANRENDLKLTVRDSINTLISDITDSMGNRKLKEYFEDKFEFGETTQAAFAGGGGGNISSFAKNLECQFCYAQHGFGQGFAITPVQMLRAYTAIANKGKMVEPRLVSKIVSPDGKIDDGSKQGSPIYRSPDRQILSEQSARLTTEYMKAVIDEGYLGSGGNPIPGYSIAAKTGTAQITRPHNGKPCDYTCNTALGLFDHTVVGFGPTKDAQILIIVKISEPRPGLVTNFADTTTMPVFREMMRYTLEYLKIPKDR